MPFQKFSLFKPVITDPKLSNETLAKVNAVAKVVSKPNILKDGKVQINFMSKPGQTTNNLKKLREIKTVSDSTDKV